MEGEIIRRANHSNQTTIDFWMPTWVKYAVQNWPWYQKRVKNYKKNKAVFGAGTFDNMTVSSLIRHPKEPCIICGSGPSLDDMVPYMADFPGPIICGATNLKTVTALSGRDPDYVCCLDSNENTIDSITDKCHKWPNTILVTHTCIHPKVLRAWTGKVKFFRPVQINNAFFEETLTHMYPDIEVGFLNAGCTANTELELANFLGCWPIIMSGIDFGFVDGLSRCTQVESIGIENDKTVWETLKLPPVIIKHMIRIADNGCPTTEEMIAYKQNFFLVARSDCPNIWTTSRGIITDKEVMGRIEPSQMKQHLKELQSNFKSYYVSAKDCEKKYDTVLGTMGVKLVHQKDGSMQVTMGDGQPLSAGTVQGIPKGQELSAGHLREFTFKMGKEGVQANEKTEKKA
jgi:hypothetical protein